MVIAICDCGNQKVIRYQQIKQGSTLTCGNCDLRYNLKSSKGTNIFSMEIRIKLIRILYSNKKHNAKRSYKKINFNLDLEQFENLIFAPCESCDDTNVSYKNHVLNGKKYSIEYTGIDRKDSNGDYDLENTQTLCQYCNRMKGDLKPEEIIRRGTGLVELAKKMLNEQ